MCEKTKNRKDEYDDPLPEIKYIPCKFLRHSGCTHLAKYHDYLETELTDYMGHSTRSDGAMVREIYGKLAPREKGYRTRNRHPELYIVNPKYELQIQIEKFDAIRDLIDADTRDNKIRDNRSIAIKENIDYLYHRKRKREYRYTVDQDWIIEEWKALNPDINDLRFVQEKAYPEDEINPAAYIDIQKKVERFKNTHQRMIDEEYGTNQSKQD